ncbi:hypothetical protein F4808DRAFT_41943 [Astrocystis sublimbata]|nr:hypothetical protein F4808DRAFT_41943 [Astrocystis sublimbata]
MSQHPYGYGPPTGHYPPGPPSSSFPMMPMSAMPADQSTYYYQQSQSAPMLPTTFAASQSAYSQNSAMIPGLGLGGNPAVPAPSFSPAAAQAWPAQGTAQPIGYSHSQPRPAPPSLPQKPPVPYQQPKTALEEGELSEGEFEDLYESRATTRPPPQNIPIHPTNHKENRRSTTGNVELYDPHNSLVAQGDSHVRAATNTNDAPDAQPELADDEWEPSYPERERSGSYSPYLSPREVHRKHSVAQATSHDTNNTYHDDSSKVAQPAAMPRTSTSTTMPRTNGNNYASGVNGNVAPASTAPRRPDAHSSPPLRSASEVKKKAQEAILGLWPHKVRYQDYLDEGIDPNIVKALFTDLGLEVPVSKQPTTAGKAISITKPAPSTAVVSSRALPQPANTTIQKTPPQLPGTQQPDKKDDKSEKNEVKATGKSAAEERKDKIARKLAAMGKKTGPAPPTQAAQVITAVSAPASAPVPAVAPAASAPPPAPTSIPAPVENDPPAGIRPDSANSQLNVAKTRAEKNNAIIQQKLAALKRQQAEKAAEKARLSSNTVTAVPSPAPVDNNPFDANGNGNATPKNGSAAPEKDHQNALPKAAPNQAIAEETMAKKEQERQDDIMRPAVSEKRDEEETAGQATENDMVRVQPNQHGSSAEGIPGISFSSLSIPQAAQGSNRNLKRPVASDFDDHSSRFDSLKRSRTNETLIIDVSDDDDDVEMEIASPLEDPSPSTDSSAAPSRQSLGTFPPPPDVHTWRQWDSPVSSAAPTPPLNQVRINLLQQRIEKERRMIAEAEAKKAAKKATTNLSSPKPMSPAPQQSVNLPKAVGGNSQKAGIANGRRDRIVSYELPLINATLKEKQDRLKQLVAEAAQLELEVQASLDEQQKLTTEMDCLVEPPAKATPEPAEQQPRTENGKYPELDMQQPAQPSNAKTISLQPPQVATHASPQKAQEQSLDTREAPSHRESPSATLGDAMDAKLNSDEALQAAILTDTACAIDIPMTDAEAPSPGIEHDAVTQETIATDMSPSSEDTHGQVETSAIQSEQNVEQSTQDDSTDADVEAVSVAASLPHESDEETSESDVSMQQSPADSSESDDDDSYEPTPAHISESHDIKQSEQEAEVKARSPLLVATTHPSQVVDEILEEPNPNHTLTSSSQPEAENASSEVKNRSYEEPPPLTDLQDIQTNVPRLEDLHFYKSPLSYFRAYRFHPKYFEEVVGGLKSMAYNAKIDPMREICPHDLAGETCPEGPSCEYQHFDSMVLQDAEIITQLGSADMFVGETRTRFIEGLKRVLNELRANRVKDFDSITKAIVKHRQEFLGDKSKVLALDSSVA